MHVIKNCVLLHLLDTVTAKVNSSLPMDVLCNNATNSSECLTTDPSCVWCDDPVSYGYGMA